MRTAPPEAPLAGGRRFPWAGSFALAKVLVAVLAVVWLDLSRGTIETHQLPDRAAVDVDLDLDGGGHVDPVIIPTGVFVESLVTLIAV